MANAKKMSVLQLTTVTAINMMGSGIILLPSKLAEIGTISIFAWILASLGATILAYAFAKCGMYNKKGGGLGGYAEYGFGKLGNFLANFTYTISLIIANIAISIGVVSYASYVFGWNLSPVGSCLTTIVVLILSASISFLGSKGTGRFGSIGVICVMIPIIGLLLFGFTSFSMDTYMQAWNPRGLPFIVTLKDSIAIILWSFLGLETACANSSAVENPEKNVPIAVLSGTLLAGIMYTLSTAIIGGIVPYTELIGANAPFGLAYAAMMGTTTGHIVSCMLVVSCFVSLTAWQFTIAEVVRNSASLGHFPHYLQKVTSRGAPYMSIFTVLIIQLVLSLMTISPTLINQFNILINLAVTINLIPYVLSMASVPAMQRIEGIDKSKRGLTNFSAFIGAVYSIYAIYGCGWSIIGDGVIVAIIGIIIFYIKKKFQNNVKISHV